MKLILFSFAVCASSCIVFIINWSWIHSRRKEDDPQLSSWLGWSRLSSIPEAEILLKLLFMPNASRLPERTRMAVLGIRVAFVTLILGIMGWFVGYYLATTAQ